MTRRSHTSKILCRLKPEHVDFSSPAPPTYRTQGFIPAQILPHGLHPAAPSRWVE